MLLVRVDTMLAPDASGDASGKCWFTRKAMQGHLVHADGWRPVPGVTADAARLLPRDVTLENDHAQRRMRR